MQPANISEATTTVSALMAPQYDGAGAPTRGTPAPFGRLGDQLQPLVEPQPSQT